MKKSLFVIVLVLISLTGVYALYNDSVGNREMKDISSSVSGPETMAFDKVNAENLSMTGICSNYEIDKSEKDCVAETTEEELPVDNDSSIVFRTICETGLNEKGYNSLRNKNSQFSVRRTLVVLLRTSDHTDSNQYAFETIMKLSAEYFRDEKWECYDYPYVLDAEVTDDGSLLRLLVKHTDQTAYYYQFNLHKKNWDEQLKKNWDIIFMSPQRFAVVGWDYVPGCLKQAFFIKPDVISISTTTGMEYAVRILDSAGLSGKIRQEGVYWNRVGDRRFLGGAFEMKSVDNGSNLTDPVDDTPPVPTDSDWEGWHKLERNIK